MIESYIRMGSNYAQIVLFVITFVWIISAASADDKQPCFRCDALSPCLDTQLVCDSLPHCANGLDEETTEGGGCYKTPEETRTLVIIYIVIGVIVCEGIAIFGVVWILMNCSCCECVCPEVHRKRREKQEARRERNKPKSQRSARSVSNRWGRHLQRSRDATARPHPELPRFLKSKSRRDPIAQTGKPYRVPENVLPTVVPNTVVNVDRSHGPLRGVGIPRPKLKVDEQQVFPSVGPISPASFNASSRDEFPVFPPEVSESAFDVGMSYGEPRTLGQKPMPILPNSHDVSDLSTMRPDSYRRSFEQDNFLGKHLQQRDCAYGVDHPDTSEMFSWSEPDQTQTTIAVAERRRNDQLDTFGPRPIIHKTTVNNLTVILPGAANHDLAGNSSAVERCTLTEIIEHDQPGTSDGPSNSNSCRQVMPFYRPRKGTNMYDVNHLC